jgi:5-methylcytosine-specific restriction endonuclease McrA
MKKQGREDYRGLYKTARWKRMRKRQLDRHPMCQCPHCRGKGLEADTVDHKKPHKGDTKLFFDPRNLQSMNKDCHDKYKQSQERGGAGFMQGCNERGEPLNVEHTWFR